MYSLILAGGQGTRLWPRSRRNTPKQLLDIASPSTMLQETFERLRPLMPPDHVYVVTNAAYKPEICRQLPLVPPANVIAEPSGRNTAPAVALGSLYIHKRDPNAVIADLHADHLVQKREEFVSVLRAAEKAAEQGYLVTIGIKPARPDTGYGYIELGDAIQSFAGRETYRVSRFTEKPDDDTAARFVEGGRHFWNSGMFIWRADHILEAIEKYLPRLYRQLSAIEPKLGTEGEEQAIEAAWQDIEPVSVDVGVLERADNVVVIPADLGWSDVGTWASLAEVLPADDSDNVVISGEHLSSDTTGAVICGRKRLIATVGLRDIVIVDTEDVILVCPKNRAQDVKDLVEKLKSQQRHEYL